MTELPQADRALRAYFTEWLTVFSAHVRAVDYAAARPLWHRDVVTFGTHRDLVRGVEATIAAQWQNVWPNTSDFAFVLDQTEVLATAGGTLAVVVAPWTSTGFDADGTPFDRPGRATLVFHHGEDGWRVVHSHMSLHRGVPQASHARASRSQAARPPG